MSFVHLHCHSEFSLLDASVRVGELVKKAAAFGMPAVAVTDHGNLHAAVPFYQAARKAGVKPIIGCEVYFTPNSRLKRGGKPELYHLLLLAKNNEGYRNLRTLVSHAASSLLEQLERRAGRPCRLDDRPSQSANHQYNRCVSVGCLKPRPPTFPWSL